MATTSHEPRRFQYRLRTLLLAMTVLCIFLAVPAAAWAVGVVTGYVAISIIAVGVLVCIQAPVFLFFHAMGWLPSRDRLGAGEYERDERGQAQFAPKTTQIEPVPRDGSSD